MFIHARWDRARRICTISRQAPLRSCAPGGCSREGCAGRAAPRPQWCCAAPASGRDGAPSDRGARAAGVARRHARSRPRDRRPRPRNAAARQSSWRCPRRRTRRRRRQRPPASRSRGRRRRRWRWPRARLAARRSTRSSGQAGGAGGACLPVHCILLCGLSLYSHAAGRPMLCSSHGQAPCAVGLRRARRRLNYGCFPCETRHRIPARRPRRALHAQHALTGGAGRARRAGPVEGRGGAPRRAGGRGGEAAAPADGVQGMIGLG